MNILTHLIPKIWAADGVVGTVTNPMTKYGNFDNASGGIVGLLTNILRLVILGAGIYALINFITAGYQYMSAAGDAKALAAAWSRIWQTLLGLVVIISSFALAALVGWLFFGEPTFILKPTLYGPEP